jgi:DNA-binding MarR family transcriptional regulator
MGDSEASEVAARLQSSAMRLLRASRRADHGGGLSAPRLSALSALARCGPMSLAALAAAEEVKAPTMSRIVEALVAAGLAPRAPPPRDPRSVVIAATAEGLRLLAADRDRGTGDLVERIRRLADSERRALARGVEILERVAR